MNKFSWSKAFGFGLLLWVSLFIIATVLSVVHATFSLWVVLALGIVGAFIAYGFAVSANPLGPAQALGYGISWVLIGLVLDALISRQIHSQIYGLWTYWFGYAMILLAPWVEEASHHHTPRLVE